MDLQELEETARLAHLCLDKDELAAALPAFEQMLGFFAAMQDADNDEAAFGAASAVLRQVKAGQAAGARLVKADHFRGDTVQASRSDSVELNENLLGNAGERDGRFIVIPNVL